MQQTHDKRLADLLSLGAGRPRLTDPEPPDLNASHEDWQTWIDAEADRLGLDLEDRQETNLTGAA